MSPSAAPTRCHCGRIRPCEKHRRKPWANPSANTKALSGRDRARLKRDQLDREPRCRRCGETERELLEADHIIEISDGGHPTDPENLQTLCHDCHEIKSALSRRQRSERRKF